MRGCAASVFTVALAVLLTTGCGVEINSGKRCHSSYTMGLSPDGQTMAVTAPDPKLDHLFLVRLHDGTRRRLATVDCDAYPSWSPNGKKIALIHDDYEIAVADLNGAARRTISGSQLARTNPHWTPEDALVYGIEDKDGAVGDWSYSVGQIPISGGKAARSIRNARFPALATNGRTIAYASDNLNDVYIAPYPTGSPAQHIANSSDDVWNIAWSPDRQWIALDTARGIRVVAADGSHATIVWLDDSAAPVWANDSRHLYFIFDKKLYATDLRDRHRRYIADLSTIATADP